MENLENKNVNQNHEFLSRQNSEFINTSIIQIRLNTSELLRDIELYLKGHYEMIRVDDKGITTSEILQVANPKANTEGIYSIMSWIKTTVNSQVVQGNIENFDALEDFLSYYRIDLANNIMINLYKWEIDEYDFGGIIDMILNLVRPFMSRLVQNKERESYSSTMQHIEKSDTVRAGKKSLPFFN